MEQTDDLISWSSEIVNPSPEDPSTAGIISGTLPHIGHFRFRMSELRTQTIRFDLQPLVMGSAYKI
jgi:hypothetical protein